MQQEHRVDAILRILQGSLRRRIVQVERLGFEQADDDVQAVLHSVIDLLHQQVLVRQQQVLFFDQLALQLVAAPGQHGQDQ